MVSKIFIIFFQIKFGMFQNFAFNVDANCNEDNNNSLVVEFYKYDDSLFMLFSEQVAWFEASSICKTYEAELCILNSTKKANFVGNFLDNSNFLFKDFWIGAKIIKTEWTWMDGQLLKDSNLAIPWFEKINDLGKECLTINKQLKHTTSKFKSSSCYELKPFICERSWTSRTKKPLPSLPAQSVTIDKSLFTFYHSRVTWHEALTFCRTLGQRLAIVPNSMHVKLLAAAMLRARPYIENAWIGGYYKDETWIWLPTGAEIQRTRKLDDYPPWYTNYSKKYNVACLLLDRHLTTNYFLPTSCQKSKDFICEKYIRIEVPVVNDTIKCSYDSSIMTIYLNNKNWFDAQKFCIDENNILAEPRNVATMKSIAVCLGDHSLEPKHVWLGGKHEKSKWIWINSLKSIDNSLPWCEDEFDEHSKCLNMDRTDHDESWIYGLQCKKEQPFVCEEGKISTTTEEPTTTQFCECPCRQPPIRMNYKNKTFVAFNFNIRAEEVKYYCKHFGGEAIRVLDNRIIRSYVLAYIRLSIDLCECCTDDSVNFWISNKFEKNDCTRINLGSEEVSKDVDCKKKMPFICETYCTSYPGIKTNENATISCEWITAAGAIPYKSCKFSCGYGYSLLGPDRFTCDKYGWKAFNVELEPAAFLFPECIKTEDTAKTLVKLINEIQTEGLYFAVKESMDLDYTKWKTSLQFIVSILQVYLISETKPFGLITFSDQAILRIAYNATNTCKVLDMIQNMYRSFKAKTSDYTVAFDKIQNEISKHHPNRKTLIVFLVDNENTGKDYDSYITKLHKNHVIFVIAVTDDKFIFDLDMVASTGDTYRLYSLKVQDYSSLTNISLDLLKYRSQHLHCTDERLYVLPNLYTERADLKQLPKTDIDLIQKNISYYIIKTYVPHMEAAYQCKNKYGGKLIDKVNSQHLLKEANLKQFHITHFWTATETDECEVMNIYSKEIEKLYCNEIFPFICMIDCSIIPHDIKIKRRKNTYELHTFDCANDGDILKGPPELLCTSNRGGWSTPGYKTSPFPLCLSTSEWIKETLTLLDAKRDVFKAGILFVIDESTTNFKQDFEIYLEFVKTIISLYPASKTLPYGLITFNSDAYLRIPYKEENSCKMLKKLDSLYKEKIKYNVSYVKALELVDKQITKFRPTQLNIVLLLTTGVFSENLIIVKETRQRLLRYNVEIYLIKIGDFDSQVATEIPTRDFDYNLNIFSIHSFTAFSKLINKLLKASQKTIIQC